MSRTIYGTVEKFVRTLQGETGTKFEEVEDLVQECCLRVLEQGGKFEGKNGCARESFIYSIVRNRLINYKIFHCRQKRDYRQTMSGKLITEHFQENYEGELPSESSIFEKLVGYDFSPEHYIEQEELASRINSLTPKRMKRLEDMSNEVSTSLQSDRFHNKIGRWIGVEPTKRKIL